MKVRAPWRIGLGGQGMALVILLLLLPIHAVRGGTFVVTNRNDSGLGTLRQAMLNANSNPGRDQIHFNLAGSAPFTIAPQTALPLITDPVILDGTTQPGYSGTPVVELEGSSAGGSASGIDVRAGDSTVRGLIINRFRGNAGIFVLTHGNNIIHGNYVGTDATGTASLGNAKTGILVANSTNNLVGGPNESARNLVSGNGFSGIQLAGAGAVNNRVEGNWVGVDRTGTRKLGNAHAGVLLFDCPSNIVGGSLAGAGNLISGNTLSGIELQGATAIGNVVQGNLVGTDLTGTLSLGNGQAGVFLSEAANNIIGGADPRAGNVVSGNDINGIELSGAGAAGNVVEGNSVGTDRGGTIAIGNNSDGISINREASGNRIGRSIAGAGNRVAFNQGDGINVDLGEGNSLRANQIYENAGLGIDLTPNGPTANDAGDGDGGANRLQNFPVLAAAAVIGAEIEVRGSLNSAPDRNFMIDIFGARTCDAAGYGEGEFYLGSVPVQTDGSGAGAFTIRVTPGGTVAVVAATATDMVGGNTSEFSACATLEAPGRPVLSAQRGPAAGEITISWLGAAGNYQLETAVALGTGGWSASSAPVREQNGRSAVTIAATGQAQFFRLKAL